MAILDRITLKNIFKPGAKPTAAVFANWIDSFWHKNDLINLDQVKGLAEELNNKTSLSDIDTILNSMTSAYLGVADKDTVAPTAGAWWYRVAEPGTYLGVFITAEDFKDAQGNYYDVTLEVKDGVATKRSRKIPAPIVDVEKYPYVSNPISAIQSKTAKAVKELYISDYDANYDYYLVQLQRAVDLTAYGYPPNRYGFKVVKRHKINNTITDEQFSQYDRPEPLGDDFVISNNKTIYMIVDWKQLNINEGLDVNFADAYKLESAVGDLINSPRIKLALQKPFYTKEEADSNFVLKTELPKANIYPYLNTPVSEKQRQVVRSIKELLIHNYDSNYNYYLIEFSLKYNAVSTGWSNCENVVKIKRIHKTTGQSDVWKLREPNCDPIDKLPTYLKFEDKFSVIVDWSQFPEGERLDVDEAEAYLLNPSVGNVNNAPLISQKNIVTETNAGKNVYYGNGVSSANGEYNMAIGKEAMQSIVDGGYNLAIGYRAMKSHKTGAGSIAIGMDALRNSTGVIDVTVVGWEAGKEMLTGVGDTGMGRRSLQKTLHANANTAFGDSTLYSLMSTPTNGVMGNIAMGYTAGEYCETIKNTILIGLACARNVKGGKGSVIIGSQAMLNRSKDSNNNVAIGENTMLSAGGNENVVVGSYTMSDNAGNENVVLGYNAGNSLTTGFRNVIVGNSAQSGATNVSDSVIVGNQAKATKSNQVVIGTVTQTEFVICGVTFTKAQLEAIKNLV